MGSCLSGPEAVGLEDEGKPGSKIITVTLTTGMEVPVWVLPTDTMKIINEKVVEVHGKQPQVYFQKTMVDPFLNVKMGKDLVPIQWEATIEEVGRSELHYSAITDQLNKLKIFTNAHWALSNAPSFIGNVSTAL